MDARMLVRRIVVHDDMLFSPAGTFLSVCPKKVGHTRSTMKPVRLASSACQLHQGMLQKSKSYLPPTTWFVLAVAEARHVRGKAEAAQ